MSADSTMLTLLHLSDVHFGPPYVPVRHKEYLHGAYDIGDARLYVNPGLGYTHRVRFCARPEVTLLTLRA